MGIDLTRSPPAALAALRYAEDLVHRVRLAFRRGRQPDDPITFLIRTHRRIHRDGDTRALRRAYEVADRLHAGQTRISGDPYISHPLATAQILAELGMDSTTLVAALLHDTVEDTAYTMASLRAEFGGEVARLVDGVTKFDRGVYGDGAEAETIRKMLITAGIDVRVLIVKLADRLHNMRTLGVRSQASRERIARATQQVLIPLANRLGVQALKRELEDCVLAAQRPAEHTQLESWVAHRPEWTAYTDRLIAEVAAVLRASGISARVVSRPRHLYSVWKDSLGLGATDPYELPRVAVIVASQENDCYTALGAVHGVWRPVPGRFKDFIASPKNNLYRSLHTTVTGPGGRAVEVLIRTEAMHTDAEYGIVSAFRFAGRVPGRHSARARDRDRAWDHAHAQARAHAQASARGKARTFARQRGTAEPVSPDQLDWLHRLLEWQRDAIDPRRFFEALRDDLAERLVHVFVDGRRLLLPANSTPVDVAYALGPRIGDRVVAATVNGQLAFLSSPLGDGDVVEILTSEETGENDPAAGPSAEWLDSVRTPRAQLHIEARLGFDARIEDPQEPPGQADRPVPYMARVRIGRCSIRVELRRRGRDLANEVPLASLAQELDYPNLQSLLVAVADQQVPAGEIADRLIEHVDGGAIEAALAALAEARTPQPRRERDLPDAGHPSQAPRGRDLPDTARTSQARPGRDLPDAARTSQAVAFPE